MNDKEYQQHRDQLTDLMDKWMPIFRLQGWHIRFEFLREPFPSMGDRLGDVHTVAITNANWAYMQADITFSIPEFSLLSTERREYVFVHEVCHILVNEMQTPGNVDTHEERVVTMLANAFINADQRFGCDHPLIEAPPELALTA